MKTIQEYCKPEEYDRVMLLHPVALMILCDALWWCHDHKIEGVVTSTVSDLAEDAKLKRQSSTHREGRAFDISCRGWGLIQKMALKQYLESKYNGYGAINKDGNPALVVIHDAGTGEHFHIQLSRSMTMPIRDFSVPFVLA